MEQANSSLHDRIDAFARRVERVIQRAERRLEAAPEFPEGASARAKDLDKFLRRFGDS